LRAGRKPAKLPVPMDLHSSTICYVRSLLPVVTAAGVTEARFFESLGIDRRLVDDIDARVPKETVARAWEISAAVSGNQSVGLLASLHAEPGSFPVLDHIAANAPTVGDALRLVARYCRLCDPELIMQYETVAAGGRIRFVFPRREGTYSRHWPEWLIGLALSRARFLAHDPELRPLEITFQHAAPDDPTVLRQILGIAPTFATPMTSIVFSHAVLAVPIRNASAFLSRMVLAYAERDLAAYDTNDRLTVHVKRILVGMLGQVTLSLAAVARQVHCSPRTLQARLKDEGTSYAKLLDEAREQLARQYIEDSSIRLIELPLLLAFADSSPFHRAFRRWTNMTPLQYRRSHQDAIAALAVLKKVG
jgi:AraC-like DNA-binding protein